MEILKAKLGHNGAQLSITLSITLSIIEKILSIAQKHNRHKPMID